MKHTEENEKLFRDTQKALRKELGAPSRDQSHRTWRIRKWGDYYEVRVTLGFSKKSRFGYGSHHDPNNWRVVVSVGTNYGTGFKERVYKAELRAVLEKVLLAIKQAEQAIVMKIESDKRKEE